MDLTKDINGVSEMLFEDAGGSQLGAEIAPGSTHQAQILSSNEKAQ
jgi:hypothetical protein